MAGGTNHDQRRQPDQSVPARGGFVDLGGSMKQGDIVKFSKPLTGGKFRFILLNEPEKGRVDIQLTCDERIKPIEIVDVCEIAAVDDAVCATG